MSKRTAKHNDEIVMTKDGQDARVIRSAFEKVWKHKDWSIKEEGPVNQTQATGTSAPKEQPTTEKTETQPKR